MTEIDKILDSKEVPDKLYDAVNHPSHYKTINGIECIEIAQHFNFNRGNAIKYIFRAGEKDKTKEIEDLQKAIKYLNFEIEKLLKEC